MYSILQYLISTIYCNRYCTVYSVLCTATVYCLPVCTPRDILSWRSQCTVLCTVYCILCTFYLCVHPGISFPGAANVQYCVLYTVYFLPVCTPRDILSWRSQCTLSIVYCILYTVYFLPVCTPRGIPSWRSQYPSSQCPAGTEILNFKF